MPSFENISSTNMQCSSLRFQLKMRTTQIDVTKSSVAWFHLRIASHGSRGYPKSEFFAKDYLLS